MLGGVSRKTRDLAGRIPRNCQRLPSEYARWPAIRLHRLRGLRRSHIEVLGPASAEQHLSILHPHRHRAQRIALARPGDA